VRYLTARYPSLLMLRDANGHTPLHCACEHDDYQGDENGAFSYAVVRLLCKAGGWRVVQMKAGKGSWVGLPPLHIFVRNKRAALDSPVSEAADCFRLLLRLCPPAAAIRDRNGRILADWVLDEYFCRLLLRAAPALRSRHREELYDINWEARRMAMFVAYKAYTANVEPTIFARLRFEDQTLLRYVVSYL
jgi:hypothetical protein